MSFDSASADVLFYVRRQKVWIFAYEGFKLNDNNTLHPFPPVF